MCYLEGCITVCKSQRRIENKRQLIFRELGKVQVYIRICCICSSLEHSKKLIMLCLDMPMAPSGYHPFVYLLARVHIMEASWETLSSRNKINQIQTLINVKSSVIYQNWSFTSLNLILDTKKGHQQKTHK